MKIKTSELTGAALDWAVCRARHPEAGMSATHVWLDTGDGEDDFLIGKTSTDWAQGGPIIEREKIRFDDLPDNGIRAFIRRPVGRREILLMDCWDEGITPLIAAMRCFVASKLGDEVDVPEELT